MKKCCLGVKILRPRYLEIEGLQSFKESQAIDFDKLGETGLFGIFGPTGSGKSTILDAITLALYGNVQRANRGTQGIINMSAANMRVSFTFDLVKSNERQTYKVERVYRRKKDSESSIESRVTRLLELGASGDVVIADKQGEVNEAVIGLIGLQFDDFTRSVVLPQNKFQEFLLSPKAEKTKMLERIFYLEEYGRELMDKVNRKLGRIRNKLSGIEGALSVLGDISETTLKETEAALTASAEHRKSMDDSLKASEAEYSGAKEVWELSIELQGAKQKQQELQSKAEEIDAIRNRCKRALAAQSLTDTVSDLKKTETELKRTTEGLEKLEAGLGELSVQLEKSKSELEKASALRQEKIPVLVEHRTKLAKALQTKSELEKMEETLQTLRNEHVLLKKKVDHWNETLATQKSKLEEGLGKVAEQKARAETLKFDASYRDNVQKGAALEEELERSQKAKEQQKARCDELLNTIERQEQELGSLERTGLKLHAEVEPVSALQDRHKEIKRWDRNDILKAETRYYGIKSITDALRLKHKDVEQLELKLSGYDKQLYALEQKMHSLSVQKTDKQGELDTRKISIEDKKKEQERNTAFLLAQNLKEHEPCPVCGATAHPHPAVHLEGIDAATSVEVIKELSSIIEKLDLECRILENEGIKLSEQHNNLRNQKEALRADVIAKQNEQNELMNKLPEEYQELSITLIEGTLDKMSGEKQERLKAIEDWENKLADLEVEHKKKAEEYNLYQVESSGKRSQLEANRKHLQELRKVYVEVEKDCSIKREAYDDIVRNLGASSMISELKRIHNSDREAENLHRELETLENIVAGQRKEIEKAEESKKLDMEKLSENIAEGRGFKYQKEEKEKEIQALLGDKDIKTEMSKTEEEMASLTGGEQKAQEYVNIVRESYERTIKDKKVFEKQREIYEDKLKSDVERLEKGLADKNFDSVQAVEDAFIPKESLEQQEMTVKQYEEQMSNTQAHKALIDKKLSGRSITEELWREISLRYEELKLEKENSIATYQNAKNRFETIKSSYANWLSLGKELQEHSRKREHLEQFKNLLKGNGFIEYISEERLRYVAKEASETLGTLTRHRYGLELDIENGFVIRDDSNGGLRRLVTSLSGGETFLASLALALALSSQIQLKGQSPLEFFFLDEGFGTLDSSLLDTVIDALERLSTQKRVIGLISHVPEMKSRITRRLIVEAPVINVSGSRVSIEKA
jgi:DNA repair protein SbcC/Rad50